MSKTTPSIIIVSLFALALGGFSTSSYLHRYIPWQDIAANWSFGGLGWAKGGKWKGGYMDGCGGMIACDENEGITVACFGLVLRGTPEEGLWSPSGRKYLCIGVEANGRGS